MAQPISGLPIIDPADLSPSDSFPITDEGNADSTKRLLYSDLLTAIDSLTNSNSDSNEPIRVAVWTGSRNTYDAIGSGNYDDGTIYFTEDGGIFLGEVTISDPLVLQVYEGPTGVAFSGYTVRVVDANAIPLSPDPNTIYFERIP